MKKFTFDDVLLVPGHSSIKSRKDVDLKQDLLGLSWEVPVISAPMDTVSGAAMANWLNSKGAKACMHRNGDPGMPDVPNDNFFAIGLNDKDKFKKLYFEKGISNFCLDVAHGDQKQVLDFISTMMVANDNFNIMAGNVVTPEATARLRDVGAKYVRVGVGSGAACSTRLMTGFGYPQLSAIKECAQVSGIGIVADGGIRTPGDVVKALAFGAHVVMMGRYLAGTWHTPGEISSSVPGGQKVYRGMASKEVNEAMFGSLGNHRAAEGESYFVPYKNQAETEQLWQNLVGGIRSGVTYAGATNLQELRDKVQYVFVTPSVTVENSVHGK